MADNVATQKLSIILSKGTLDMVYPAFILANTAAVMGYEVNVFFTFWGMFAASKKSVNKLKISPVANPTMPMPNIIGMLPGMTHLMTAMMSSKIKKTKIPDVYTMIKNAKKAGVKLNACSTTMAVMDVKKEDLLPEIDGMVGAATFISMSEGGQIIFI